VARWSPQAKKKPHPINRIKFLAQKSGNRLSKRPVPPLRGRGFAGAAGGRNGLNVGDNVWDHRACHAPKLLKAEADSAGGDQPKILLNEDHAPWGGKLPGS